MRRSGRASETPLLWVAELRPAFGEPLVRVAELRPAPADLRAAPRQRAFAEQRVAAGRALAKVMVAVGLAPARVTVAVG